MPFALLLQAAPPPLPAPSAQGTEQWPPPKANDGPGIVPRSYSPPPPAVARSAPASHEVLPPAAWMGRISFGFGSTNDSGQTALLRREGYSVRETLVSLDGAKFVRPWLGVGGFFTYATTTGTAQSSPGLNRWSISGGAEAPMAGGERGSVRVLFTPRLGVARGTQDFGGPARGRLAPYIGATFDLLPFYGLIGFGVWASYAPASAPGGAGRRDDLGSVGFQLTGALDGD